MEILTGEQMRRVDRRAIEVLGIRSLDLMESAGRGVARTLVEHYPDAPSRGVIVLCGKGNNGGDGFVAARRLLERGIRPTVIALARADEIKGDAAANLSRAREAGLEIHEAADEAAWALLRDGLRPGILVVDAILGTGVRGGAQGLAARVIEDLNASGARVVSVDLPSGLNADTAELEGLAVRAERTYTLCRPKLALVAGPAAALAGELTVVPIGIPDEAVRAEAPLAEWIEPTGLAGLVQSRPADAHKGTYGHLLAVAGSKGKPGAAVLVARGALRSGVGLVTVATPEAARPTVAAQQAEVMVEGLPATARGQLGRRAVTPALRLARERDALAVGPGLGLGVETSAFVVSVLRRAGRPAVVDADGLNALARGEALRFLEQGLVLTPHPGEAARLLGSTAAEVQRDRLGAARQLSELSRAVVALKGHRTVVASPEGRIAVNSTGNPGMATAGTGDVLTGIVGSFLARGLSPWDAARLAVFVHGAAGDRAAALRGQEGLIASDLLEALPSTLQALVQG
jgi:NAD(P)H-hydrate epimerase